MVEDGSMINGEVDGWRDKMSCQSVWGGQRSGRGGGSLQGWKHSRGEGSPRFSLSPFLFISFVTTASFLHPSILTTSRGGEKWEEGGGRGNDLNCKLREEEKKRRRRWWQTRFNERRMDEKWGREGGKGEVREEVVTWFIQEVGETED